MLIKGTHVPRKWDEKPYDVFENRMKSTKASVEFASAGDFEGTAHAEYLMFYKSFDPKDPHKAVAQYVGLFKLDGKLKGKAGTFVMTVSGGYESGLAQSKLSIIPGSGTGELSKISGSGSDRSDPSGGKWDLDVTV
jgi:hypothetical protein